MARYTSSSFTCTAVVAERMLIWWMHWTLVPGAWFGVIFLLQGSFSICCISLNQPLAQFPLCKRKATICPPLHLSALGCLYCLDYKVCVVRRISYCLPVVSNAARPVWVGIFRLDPTISIANTHDLLVVRVSTFIILTKLASERRTLEGFCFTKFLFLNYIIKSNNIVHVNMCVRFFVYKILWVSFTFHICFIFLIKCSPNKLPFH